MDKGQPVNNPNIVPFSANNNSPEMTQYSPKRDLKNLGNTATSSGQTGAPTETLNQAEKPGEPNLVEVVNLEMPPKQPGQANQGAEPKPGEAEAKVINFADISTSKNLNKSGIKAVEAAKSELAQDGDTFKFYEKVRGEGGLTEINLENSFGRKAA